LEQPAAHDRAVLPQRRELPEVELELGRVHDLEPLGERLHHPVLDPVVDHLHEVARAGPADVRVTAFLGERPAQRLDDGERVGVAPDHDAVAALEPPDPALHAGVEEAHAFLGGAAGPPLRVAEVRVAAVDEHVAGLEQPEQRLVCALGRVAGGDHQPADPRRLELADELLEGRHRARRVGARVGLDLVPVAAQALGHVAAHAAEAHQADAHQAATSSPRLARMPSSSSEKESSNFWTPSCSSVSVTSSTSTPTRSSSRSSDRAWSIPSSRVSATVPWSWNASTVSSGIVLIVSGPIRLST